MRGFYRDTGLPVDAAAEETGAGGYWRWRILALEASLAL
jgi:hypothetical protein